MASPGQLLREERLKRCRSLSEIAAITCISNRYLEAIEEDNLTLLPGDFFYRSFLKQYAEALELDAISTEKVLNSTQKAAVFDPIPALAAAYEVAEIDARRSSRQPSAIVALGLLAAVILGCSGLYSIWQRSTASEEPPETAPPKQTLIDPIEPIKPASAAPKTDVAELGGVRVELSATEPTWVSLSSEGRTVFRGLLDVAQTKYFAVNEQAKLLTGNAAGLDVRLNGKPVGPIGQRGQIRVLLISQGSFAILPYRKL